jgi:hypothetical protein
METLPPTTVDINDFRRYGVALREHGDPRGEFVLLSCDLTERPDPAVKRRVASLSKKLRVQLLGKELAALDETGQAPKLGWFCGMIRSAHFVYLHPVAALSALATSPSAVGPLDLTICAALDDPSSTLAATPPCQIHSLTYGSPDSYVDLHEVSRALPIERLVIYGTASDLGRASSETIGHLAVYAEYGLTAQDLQQVVSARFSKLETLVLDFGALGMRPEVEAILAELGSSMPAIRHLSLRNAQRIAAVAKIVAQGRIGMQLETLDLSFEPRGQDSEEEHDLMFQTSEVAEIVRGSKLKVGFGQSFSRAAEFAIKEAHPGVFSMGASGEPGAGRRKRV